MNSSAPRADSISCKALVAPGWLKATYSAAFSKEPQSSSATSKRKCFRRNLDTMELSEGSMGISTSYGCIRTPHYAGYAFLLKVWEYLAASPRSEEHTSELQSLMRISYAVFCLK